MSDTSISGTPKSNVQLFDALVIGGGPSGTSTALMLARSGMQVALVEKADFPRRKVCGEYLSATNTPLLKELEIHADFARSAGPAIKRVAIFAQSKSVTAPLPRNQEYRLCGRALSRDKLDTLLLNRAQAAGVVVYQPYACDQLTRLGSTFVASATNAHTREPIHCEAALVIAAHGSWHKQECGTFTPRSKSRPSDLFGFKAHFAEANLKSSLMPLLSFHGGYGGMVNCDAGRTSLSCCLRRDRLNALDRTNGRSAGDAVLEHIFRSTPVLKPVLDGAEVEGAWMCAGPLQPGIRPAYRDGIFYVGNAAGEAHPIIAEGISMALQSGWLVAKHLTEWHSRGANAAELLQVGQQYTQAWRQHFAPRLRFAAGLAHWAMRPWLVSASCEVTRRIPRLLTWGAQLSGKDTFVVS